MNDVSLIKNWHEKAKEDYFSRYTFQYLAFEAFLKKYKYEEGEIQRLAGNKKERAYIQTVKNEYSYITAWAELVAENLDFRKKVTELVVILKKNPMTSGDAWWGCMDYDCNNNEAIVQKGAIQSEDDFGDMVEFWYQVRNNFFHANKNPNDKRDEILVAYAQQTLGMFMETVLLPEIDRRTFSPAIWEEFEHRFFNGDAEVTTGIHGRGGAANVYELLFLPDYHYPIILGDKKINRDYIIEKLIFNVHNLYGDPDLLGEHWKNIKRRAKNEDDLKKLKIYFKDVIPLLEDVLGDLGLDP